MSVEAGVEVELSTTPNDTPCTYNRGRCGNPATWIAERPCCGISRYVCDPCRARVAEIDEINTLEATVVNDRDPCCGACHVRPAPELEWRPL